MNTEQTCMPRGPLGYPAAILIPSQGRISLRLKAAIWALGITATPASEAPSCSPPAAMTGTTHQYQTVPTPPQFYNRQPSSRCSNWLLHHWDEPHAAVR